MPLAARQPVLGLSTLVPPKPFLRGIGISGRRLAICILVNATRFAPAADTGPGAKHHDHDKDRELKKVAIRSEPSENVDRAASAADPANNR